MESLSLYQLNNGIKGVLGRGVPAGLWVRAEIHGLSVSGGHCYLDLIEKESGGDRIIARQKATVWAGVYGGVVEKFQKATGQRLQAGISVLLQVNVEFHELYGMSLNVRDIDPDYTLGALQRRRNEIIESLKKRGLTELNRRLPLPELPQRIAVISSATAAGYSDFMHQLENNAYGFKYLVRLFPAVMQGAQTEESVVKALCDIHRSEERFDLVVIIRGGGAGSDLYSFDSERLAVACARFPLPIISGIGHLRDMSIVDIVAHTAVKTPTAAAEFIVALTLKTAERLADLQVRMVEAAMSLINSSAERLTAATRRLPYAVTKAVGSERMSLVSIGSRLSGLAKKHLSANEVRLERTAGVVERAAMGMLQRASLGISMQENRLRTGVMRTMSAQQAKLELLDTKLSLLDPKRILRQGYSITLCGGRPVMSAGALRDGDELTTLLADGMVTSKVIDKQTDK